MDNATARSVFIIGPDKRIKAMLTYPMSTGHPALGIGCGCEGGVPGWVEGAAALHAGGSPTQIIDGIVGLWDLAPANSISFAPPGPLARHVFMILRPTFRFFTGPLPPFAFEARFLAAVIRPPRLFFAMERSPFWT